MADNYSAVFTDHVPQEHLKAIGTVAVAFSWLEMFLEMAIHVMADTWEDRGPAITTHMPTPLRLSAFLSLAHIHFEGNPEAIKEAEALVNEIKDRAAERAKIIHGLWMFPSSEDLHPSLSLTKARTKVEKSLNEMPVEDIKLIKQNITATTDRMIDFHLAHLGGDPADEE